MQKISHIITPEVPIAGLDKYSHIKSEAEITPYKVDNPNLGCLLLGQNIRFNYTRVWTIDMAEASTVVPPALLSALVIGHEIGHTLDSRRIELDLFDPLGDIYSYRIRIPNPKIVREYLLANRGMVALMKSVCRDASKIFGRKAVLTLEIYMDPEVQDDHLLLSVKSGNDFEKDFKKIDTIIDMNKDVFRNAPNRIHIMPDDRGSF